MLTVDTGEPWRVLHSRTRLLQQKSFRGIGPHQRIVADKVGGNQPSNKASVTDLQKLPPAMCMYAPYQYEPMTEFLEGGLGWDF